MQAEIIYQDEHILLCLKSAGMDSERELPALLRLQTGVESIFCVHRLDRATGGLMVYAKSPRAASALSALITAGDMQKSYLAVVQGQPEDSAVLHDLLFRDPAKNKSYVVRRVRRGVREAELSYTCLQRTQELSLLRIQLKTGRTHQIRVQFASRAMPLVGDLRYGSSYRDCALALWCERLSFSHPVTGEPVDRQCSPPSVWPWTDFIA